MKFGICNELFKGWSMEDAFSFVGRTGYDAIEIAPFTLAPYVTDVSKVKRQELKELAAQNGIFISGIHWVLVQAEGMYLTHPDKEIRDKTAQYFCDLVDFCADLGGRSIVVGSPKQRNLMEGVTYEQAWDWATDVFRRSVHRAEDREVVICFEPLAPSETDFITTAEEGLRFVKQLNTPHFKIILDVKAMSSESKPIPQIIRESAPNFGYFHANDANLKGPGFGAVDFVPIAAALKEVRYEGVVSVEVFNYDEGPEVIATKSLEYMKASWAKADEGLGF